MSIFDFFRGENPAQAPTLTHDDVIATINKDKQISVFKEKPREEQLTEALQAMAWAAIDNGGVMATADSEADGYGVSTAIPMDIMTWYARQTFIGWQACSIMSTHWLIGRACSMPIDDAIKNGFKITACGSDTSISDDVAKILRESDKKHDLNKRLHNFGFFGRVFGVRVAIFRIEGYTAEEYGKPLNLDDVSSSRKYKGLALVDPQYCTPVVTNSSNPIADDFMKVTYWQVGGIRYHHSFCVEYVHQEVAQTMRGVYMNAGAISLVQQIYEKVYLAEQAASEANRLLFSKRVWVRSGDVESALLDQVAFEGKMNFFARAINNFGTLLLGENEQLNKHETSLQEVTGVIGQKFEHVSAVSGIPCNRLMMTQLTGFAASGEAEEKIYLDMVSNIQCNQLVPVVEMHTRLTLLSNDLPADDFEVTFNPATSFTAKELADINAQKAQTDSTLAQIQAISSEAIAEKWAKDPHGGFAGIDLADYAAQEQEDFNADMTGFDAIETADAEKWITVGGGTNAQTGEGSGRKFQIDTETGKILKGGGAGMVGKTFKEAFSDDNKTLTERQKLSRRITAHAAKKHGGDNQDFTRLTNKGAEGKSSDWHAKTFLESGILPSELQNQQDDKDWHNLSHADKTNALIDRLGMSKKEAEKMANYTTTSPFRDMNADLDDVVNQPQPQQPPNAPIEGGDVPSEYQEKPSGEQQKKPIDKKNITLTNVDSGLTVVDKKIIKELIAGRHPLGTKAKSDRKIAELIDVDHDKGTGKIRVTHKEDDGFGRMRDVSHTKSFSWKTNEQPQNLAPSPVLQNDLTTNKITNTLSSTSHVGAATGESKMSISMKKNTTNSELELARQEYNKASELMTSADSHEKVESARQELNATLQILYTAKEKLRILDLAEKVEGLKVMQVSGLGTVLTANGKDPFKVIGSGDAERIMKELAITGKIVRRGASKFIVPDENTNTDKSLIAAKINAAPMHAMINKREDGSFGVKIPFDMKDAFKKRFSGAKWDNTTKEWTVGKLSGAKLNDWLQDKIPHIEEKAASKTAFDAKKQEMHPLTGNTYKLKDQLKEKFGAIYDGDKKTWRVPAEHKEAAQQMVNEHNASNRTNTNTNTNTNGSYSSGQSGMYSWNTSPEEAAAAGIDWFDLEG